MQFENMWRRVFGGFFSSQKNSHVLTYAYGMINSLNMNMNHGIIYKLIVSTTDENGCVRMELKTFTKYPFSEDAFNFSTEKKYITAFADRRNGGCG